MKCAAIIVAGGAGTRADPTASEQPPKQYRMLAGQAVIARALAPFLSHRAVDHVQIVVRPGTEAAYRTHVGSHPRLAGPVSGGESRQASVRLGLEAIQDVAPEIVLIHDAARPFASIRLIDRVVSALHGRVGAVPAVPVADTLKRANALGMVEATMDRTGLFAVQTPQGFRYAPILDAHRRAASDPRSFTDDAAIAEWAGLEVALVQGERCNLKLTTPEDFELAEAQIGAREETRIGSGYDVHRFGEGDRVTLCGVSIPHVQALSGHSDADVGLHALTDALLGAIAEGDIGSHFPPSEERWRGADSAIFLSHAAELVRKKHGRIVNVDITIICEAPKIGGHRDRMRARIAEILEVEAARIAVKATTSEGLGFTGRNEGIAAYATVSVALSIGRNVQ